MSIRSLLAVALAAGLAFATASARADLAQWDQAKVTALSKQLADAAKALQDTFYKQPTPTIGSANSRDYYRLKQVVRRLRQEADQLQGDLAKGSAREETLPEYDDLMQSVRDAREIGARIFAAQDIKDRATAVRAVLNELAPYYDPDAVPLQPVQR